MYYGEIKPCDIANGAGVRVSLFVSGCTNRCEHCFQPQTRDFSYGQPFTETTQTYLLSLLAPSYISGLTLLGGEPFEPENQRSLVPFLRRVRAARPEKDIWCFTGFTWEELHMPGSHPRCAVTDEPVRGRAARHLSAVSGQLQSAADRPERYPPDGPADPSAGPGRPPPGRTAVGGRLPLLPPPKPAQTTKGRPFGRPFRRLTKRGPTARRHHAKTATALC